jgi:predicted O-methyltransferase YrrM
MKFFKKKKPQDVLPYPTDASHQEYSLILSQHDEKAKPSSKLILLSLQAIEKANTIDLSHLSKRLSSPPYYPEIWPGEHYKLLAGFVSVLKPKVIIEIGTATGLSALALKEKLPKDGKVHTFDLFSYQQDSQTVLKESDFSDHRLLQHVDDLSQSQTMKQYSPILREASLIFIDATHDGALEKKLLDMLCHIPFDHPVYLLFDDIRVWSMLKMWREITLPKLDLTSFGHWSGTGIVELS